MSSVLTSYETEFQTSFEQTINALKGAPAQQLPQRNSTLKQIEEQKDELLDLTDQMDIEINNSMSMNPNDRAIYKAKLRQYKKDIESQIKIPLQKLIDMKDRDLLFGDSLNNMNNNNNGMDGTTEEQRQQMLANHAILQKSGDKLKDASRLANETEGIGSQIMMDLRSQRETLENSRQTLFQADSYVDKSIRTLKVMSTRLIANKFISYAIIAVLILLILLVLFSKFRS
ncbi:v-SNARE protein VTI1 NDAI_0I00660 [Naumovozyma dairenensis CBS 421]|uniref:t-SNARE coiled-coil homology domain-containing protein n=1 Tax=Naumovozyma dairenensis (strain ATCC 10597 / BCRC 20456 / CBS 421 / NBRC 0211 / NRRL Y-12639) TaxID=1071378 RepID=G0WFS4_NAUDC|nr:hypothetical protein NDAI_0I00660 [Naumovozyma dairenensis CBS 421]CCD26635.1 hypothetical protein NDAI_0I00660 [Naumovozyma dairenensis CBS 421]